MQPPSPPPTDSQFRVRCDQRVNKGRRRCGQRLAFAGILSDDRARNHFGRAAGFPVLSLLQPHQLQRLALGGLRDPVGSGLATQNVRYCNLVNVQRLGQLSEGTAMALQDATRFDEGHDNVNRYLKSVNQPHAPDAIILRPAERPVEQVWTGQNRFGWKCGRRSPTLRSFFPRDKPGRIHSIPRRAPSQPVYRIQPSSDSVSACGGAGRIYVTAPDSAWKNGSRCPHATAEVLGQFALRSGGARRGGVQTMRTDGQGALPGIVALGWQPHFLLDRLENG
jgi:hypothetical protein